MKASWDDYSPYMENHKIHVPNHQPVMCVWVCRNCILNAQLSSPAQEQYGSNMAHDHLQDDFPMAVPCIFKEIGMDM